MFEWLEGLLNDNSKPKPKIEKIVVAKPCCSPARNTITRIFKEYGVKIYGLTETEKLVTIDGKKVPALFIATVKVSSKQVVWAEYLLLRSHQFMLWGKAKHPRNEEWALKHNVMPESWNGKPLIEKGCSELKKHKQRR